jgi:hypothetical protein
MPAPPPLQLSVMSPVPVVPPDNVSGLEEVAIKVIRLLFNVIALEIVRAPREVLEILVTFRPIVALMVVTAPKFMP